MNHYVYRFYNKKDEIIYVGRTSEGIRERMNGHFKSGHLPSECYNDSTKIDYCEFPTKVDSKIAEMFLINQYKPIYNTSDKEYKNLVVHVELQCEWKLFDFDTKEEAITKRLYRTIRELKEDIKQNKEEYKELEGYFLVIKDQKKEMENTMSYTLGFLDHKKYQMSVDENVCFDIKFLEDIRKMIYNKYVKNEGTSDDWNKNDLENKIAN